MSKAWETTREPGLSWLRIFGFNRKLTSGSKYMVTPKPPKIDGENVLLANLGLLLNAGLRMFSRRLLDQITVDFEPHRFGAFFRGGDDDAAVAGAEIVDDIALLDAGEFDHLVDDFLWCRYERHDLFVFEDAVLGERDAVKRVGCSDDKSR